MFKLNPASHSSSKTPRHRGLTAAARRSLVAVALGASFLSTHGAYAGTKAWDTSGNANGNFSGATNWTVGTVGVAGPGTSPAASGDSLYFDASTITTLLDDLAAGSSFAGLTFNSDASAYTISGNSFALTSGITNSSANLQIINDILTLAATQTFTTTTGGGNLTLGGNISGAGGVTAAGGGILTLGGTNTYTGVTTIGNGATLAFTGTGASTIGTISLGASSTGTLNLSGTGSLTTSNNDFQQGSGTNTSVGVINQSNGTFNIGANGANQLNLGYAGGSYGAYTLSGGTLNVNVIRNGGYGGGLGNSYFLQTGGTVNNGGLMAIGRSSGTATGTNIFYMTGGVFNNKASDVYLGNNGTSLDDVLTVAGGTLTAATTGGTGFQFGGAGAGVTAILNMNGGIVSTNQIQDNSTASTSIVNFNGGTLQANLQAGKAGVNATFFGTNAFSSVNIFSGGATIDTNGNAITINQALRAPGGNGVSSIALAGNGTGYIAAPVVTISGGGGTGASAVAVLGTGANAGQITGITMTSFGTGYTGTPTVTLSGGLGTGGTAAALGTISTAANTSGGLTKIGGGTLTLTGTNTYTGTTTVNAGTLQLGFTTAGASNILASGNALALGGGTLNDNTTATTGTNTQTLGALAINGGANTLSMSTSGAANNLVFTGGLTRTAGSVDFITPTNTSITIQGNPNTAAFGSYAFIGTGATETYAGTNGAGLVQAATLTATTGINDFNSATTDYAYTSPSPGNPDQLTANRTADAGAFTTAGPQTIDLNGANTLTLNGILNTGAALTILNSVSGGTGTLNIGSNNELIISGSSAITIGAPIANNGATASALTDSNTGTLTLTGVNTYTGATTVGSGSTLQLGDGTSGDDGTIAGSSGITDNGTLIYNRFGTLTSSVPISGTGTLTKTGAGTQILTGANTYAGATTITAGTLQLGNGGTTGSLSTSSAITDNANFTINETGTVTQGTNFSGAAISGTGSLTQAGSGKLTLTTNNTYSGGTFVNAGTLQLNNGGGTGSVRGTVTVNSGATLTLNAGNALGYNAAVAGVAQSVTTVNINGGTVNTNATTGQEGYITAFNLTGGTLAYAGTADATGNNAYQIAAGDATAPGITSNASTTTSVISGGVAIRSGNLKYTVASGSTASGIDLLDSGLITGGNAITKLGAGVLALTGVNTYSAGTTVSAGTLEGTTAGLQGAITDNAALVFDQSLSSLATGTYGGVISGSGTVAKNNAGAATLSGANTYNGATSVNGGSLYVNGSLASAGTVSVAGGARLGGTGSVGATTVASGGSVEGGQYNAGTLTTNGLTFSGTGNAYIGNLGSYITTPAIAAGALTVNGGANSVTLNISGTIPGTGTYELLGYTGGSIAGTGNSAFQLATLPNRATGTLDFTHAGLIDLDVTGSDFLIWTGATTNSWDTVTQNWKLNSNGAPTTYIDTPGDTVVFDDTAATGTVNLNSGDVHPTSVAFNDNTLNYTVQGANAIAGTTGLTKTGTGTLTLTNTNSYTGLTALNGGILNVGSTGALGTASAISFSGGTLQYSAANQTDYSSRFSAGANQAYSVDTNGQNVTYASALTSSGGSLAKTGAGTLTLGTFETYTGGTTVNGGTLKLTTSSGSGNVQGAITVNTGGTLSLTTQDDLGYTVGSQVTALNINGGTVDIATGGNEGYSTNVNLTGGTLSSSGGGTFRFNNGTGSTFGVTTIGSAATSTISTKVDNFNGPLNFNVASGTTPSGVDLLVSGQIYDNAITKSGTGTMQLSNNTNSFTGSVTINGGTLVANTGTIATTTDLGSDAAAGRSITVNTGGILSLTGNDIFGTNAATNIPNLIINSGGTVSSTRFNTIGAVSLNGGTLYQNSIDGSTAGVANPTAQYQGYQFSGAVTVGGTAASTISSGSIGNGDQLSSAAGGTTFNVGMTGAAGPDLTVSSVLTNSSATAGTTPSSLVKTGLGTMALTAANNYSGATTVSAGTLDLDNQNALQNSTLTTAGVTFDSAVTGNAFTFGGLTGSGNLALQNTQTNVSNPAGGVAVALTIGGNNASNAYSGVLSGGGSLTKTGTGAETLTGTNTYSGGTTVNAGTLSLNAAGADSSGVLVVGNATSAGTEFSGGTVDLNTDTSAQGSATGAGNVTLANGGTVFNGAGVSASPVTGVPVTGTATGGTPPAPNASGGAPPTNNTQTFGTLTIGGATTYIDFGANNTGGVFKFANSSAAPWTGTLDVYDWAGNDPTTLGTQNANGTFTGGTGGGGLDELFIGTDATGLTTAQLGDIQFYSDNGKTLLGPADILTNGEIAAAPEPSQVGMLGLMAAGLAGLLLRAKNKKRSKGDAPRA